MPGLSGGILVAGTKIIWFKEIILGENLLLGRARGEQIQDILNAQPESPDAGTPTALSRLNRNAIQEILTHGSTLHQKLRLGESSFESPV
jgi:hypothetical protein